MLTKNLKTFPPTTMIQAAEWSWMTKIRCVKRQILKNLWEIELLLAFRNQKQMLCNCCNCEIYIHGVPSSAMWLLPQGLCSWVLAAWFESSLPRLKTSRFVQRLLLCMQKDVRVFSPQERWNSKVWSSNLQGRLGSCVWSGFCPSLGKMS